MHFADHQSAVGGEVQLHIHREREALASGRIMNFTVNEREKCSYCASSSIYRHNRLNFTPDWIHKVNLKGKKCVFFSKVRWLGHKNFTSSRQLFTWAPLNRESWLRRRRRRWSVLRWCEKISTRKCFLNFSASWWQEGKSIFYYIAMSDEGNMNYRSSAPLTASPSDASHRSCLPSSHHRCKTSNSNRSHRVHTQPLRSCWEEKWYVRRRWARKVDILNK